MNKNYIYICMLATSFAVVLRMPTRWLISNRSSLLINAGVTIPSNIAPLDFKIVGGGDAYALLQVVVSNSVHGANGCLILVYNEEDA